MSIWAHLYIKKFKFDITDNYGIFTEFSINCIKYTFTDFGSGFELFFVGFGLTLSRTFGFG